MTTFFTLSAKQAVREQRIPFEISLRVPNAETIEAIEYEIVDDELILYLTRTGIHSDLF